MVMWRSLPPERVAQLKAFESGSPLPFTVRLRGYDAVQVRDYFRRLAAAAGAGSADGIERPAFGVSLRGYDRRQVDAFLEPIFPGA